MQWLNELPFADNRVLQIGFLAACGIAALIVLAIFYRLAFAHRLRVPGGRTRQPRLGLVDAFSLDGQRQLVLVRRDNIEHLVMIGGPNDVLVELQINRAAAPARESNQVSPLLVPPTPARRTEAAVVAGPAAPEAPAKAAAKAPASPPAPPPVSPLPASPPAPVPAAPVPTAPSRRPQLRRSRRHRSRRRPAAQPTAPVSAQASIPAQPSASEPARPAPLRRRRRKRRSRPDRRPQIRRRVRRRRVPHNRARRCPRRSFPPTPRRTVGLRFALRKQVPREARAIPRPRLLSRLRRRAARRNRSRRSPARNRSSRRGGENGAACGVSRNRIRLRPARPRLKRGLRRRRRRRRRRPTGRKKQPTPARQRTRRPRRTASRRPKSTIPSPTSICSRPRWRVCSAAKSQIDARSPGLRLDYRRRRALGPANRADDLSLRKPRPRRADGPRRQSPQPATANHSSR